MELFSVTKCKFCDKSSYISYSSTVGLVGVCQYHYKVKLIEEMESTEYVKPICGRCKDSVMRFNGIGTIGDSVLVNFICVNCMNMTTEKRKIDTYFKNG